MPAVMCSKCAADLPDGAQFCLQCGQPVGVPAGTSVESPIAVLGCSKCGTSLPDGAEFCPKCGKPVSLPKTSTVRTPPPDFNQAPSLPRTKKKRTRWI